MKVTTRRSFFQYMAVLGLATFTTTPLYAKGTKAQYLYQESPKDGKQCSLCMHFIPESNECRMVEGSISPNGYCAAFYKKPEKNK
ncbi:MAG: iron oxidase oxidoreductase [Sulfurimonas sp.]|nr:iron oxidase oxidoreductase [Sulfurimonas sp.]